MYNELNKHKKSDSIKWVTVFVAIVLLFAGVVAALVPVYGQKTDKETDTTEALAAEDFSIEMISSEGIRLASGPMMASAGGQSVSKTLTASVTPSSAQNKAVDWSVKWAESGKSEAVSEYVTVTPQSDGALTATVTCYKAFEGEILVTVTTREGGLKAECIVTFIGIPSSLSINGSNAQSNANIGSYYKIGAGNDYSFNIVPSNVFGQVGAECNYKVTVKGVGGIATQMWSVTYNSWNGSLIDDSDEVIVDISTITQINSETPGFFFDCSISGSTLTIHGNSSLESYYGGTHVGSDPRSGTFQDNKFKHYVDDNWYFEVKVTETNSGISNTIKVRPYLTVNNVSLSANNISF